MFGSVNNYNREKNKRRKINSSGGNILNKNKMNKNNNINDIDCFLVKARTPNFGAKNINYINNNSNTGDKNKIKKPRTPEIKNIIIFVFGGITFEEVRDLTLLGNQLGVNIICGGTNIINSKSFLAEMSLIKEKMSSGNDQTLIVG